MPDIPKELDWSLFATSGTSNFVSAVVTREHSHFVDPTPFRTLATASRFSYAQQHRAPTKQASELTPLQQYARTSRATLLDPVLSSLPPLSSEEDEPPDPEEVRKMQEREKIRELKRRKVHGGSTRSYGFSGLGLRKTDAEAVFVRDDQADESAEVDIDAREAAKNGKAQAVTPAPLSQVVMDVDEPASSIPPTYATKSWPPPDVPASTSHTHRTRRPTQKAAHSRKAAGSSTRKKIAPPTSPTLLPETPVEEQPLDSKGKPRPDTYKQAWSVSEQHLLERLLEEIPDGEKNRYAFVFSY